MSKLFSLVFCGALLTLPLAMGCNNATDPEPIGVQEDAGGEGVTEEVEMQEQP